MILLIGAHIDDLVIGLPSILFDPSLDKYIVIVSDDTPPIAAYPKAYESVSTDNYALALAKEYSKIRELTQAKKVQILGFQDTNLENSSEVISQAIRNITSKNVFEAAYIPAVQGGNSDHDTTHFACLGLLKAVKIPTLEYALYYKEADKYVHNVFMDAPQLSKNLSPDILLKKQMILSELQTKSADTPWFIDDKTESIRRIET